MFKATLKFTNAAKTIENRAVKALSTQAQPVVFEELDKITDEIKDFFTNKFKESDTYASLVSGDLRAEFGLDDAAVGRLPEIVRNMFFILYPSQFAHEVKLDGLKIVVTSFKLETNSDTSGADYYSNGHLINWLDWLLYGGTQEQVSNYRVSYRPDRGRSNMAVMIGPNEEFSYIVDAHFAGTLSSNWISRTIQENKTEFLALIKKYFKRVKRKVGK